MSTTNHSPSLVELPTYLAERTRVVQTGQVIGEMVLYWMSTAMRSDENPALDVAKTYAQKYELPLLIYQGLSDRYRFASDRHHQFILQGARDLQKQFKQQQIGYAFFLQTPEDRRPHLLSLANRAAVVVTEDMPVQPPHRFLRAISRQTNTPIVAVNTACIVAPQQVGKAFQRAFEFRNATKTLYAERLNRIWPAFDSPVKTYDIESLDFKPVDLGNNSISKLVSQCEIDHLVPAIKHSTGGAIAGYQRWNDFKQSGLMSYANKRNNPLNLGTSRLSAYLHYGMVSPFRIAREAADVKGKGSEKFLDELLIWRELAHHFCFYYSNHDRWSGIPGWARESFESHALDQRDYVYSWEQLSRGKTHDSFWNACQQTLVRTGELHNNLRMTWGKALLSWTKHPKQALDWLIDLNNRYALDGRDPSSYGGLLWCLGLFDRPFQPEQPVIGTVRPRHTSEHARRLSLDDYEQFVKKTYRYPNASVAVIGAGLSGLIAARTLNEQGTEVVVFEKSRGVGGRMSTRRSDMGSFDHGAQYFTVRDRRFQTFVNAWREQGIVQKWPTESVSERQSIVVIENGTVEYKSESPERFVAAPGMNSICKHLARDLNVQLETRIDRVQRNEAGKLELIDAEQKSLGEFDYVIVSAPAEQSFAIVREFPTLANQVSDIRMNPCWACLASLEKPLDVPWSGAFIHDSFLTWVARNSTKPDRDKSTENLVIHASPGWTQEHWDSDPETVQRLMLDEFWRVMGQARVQVIGAQVHRWKYAIAEQGNSAQCFFDEEAGIAICGDWACGSRIEGAFLSGTAAFARIQNEMANQEAHKTQQSLF